MDQFPDIDQAVVKEMKELLGDSFERLVHKYITSTAEGLHLMKEAIASKKEEQLIFQGHKIKSSSAQVGAKKLSMIAAKLEEIGRAGMNAQEASRLCEQGIESLEKFKQEVF